MSSSSTGFSGGAPDFSGGGGGGGGGFGRRTLSTNNNNPYGSQFQGILTDPVSQIVRRPDLTGKRSLAEFQAHHLHQQQTSLLQLQLQQQQEQRMNLYLRNVRHRNLQQSPLISPLSPADFAAASIGITARQGYPIQQQSPSFGYGHNVLPPSGIPSVPVSSYRNPDSNLDDAAQLSGKAVENKIQNCLLELEKHLLNDDDDDEQGEAVSVITNTEWSETFQELLTPPPPPTPPFVSLSPASSSSSCSSPPITSPRQSLIDAASAISEGKTDVATEILSRLNQSANTKGTSEQRITSYMVTALKSRINPTDYPPPVSELYGKEHNFSTQMLYEGSPCFKFGFIAANLSILEAISDHPSGKLHVVDFDVGKGSQFLHLIHSLAARKKPISLKITTFVDLGCDREDRLKAIGGMLKAEADKIGVDLNFNVNHRNNNTLMSLVDYVIVDPEEALAVNLAFQLYRLPDESVTTENRRDSLLRQVKSLSPAVVTMVEQEMNVNTASFISRVGEAYDYYGSLFESLEATVPNRDNPERVRVEEGLGRRAANSVACEGNKRIERCEVLGKWRMRMGMAGFKGRVMSQEMGDSLRARLETGTRVNPGFTVKVENGNICFGWKGRTLTVASAWH